MRLLRASYPVLFAVHPVLLLYAANRAEVEAADVVAPLGAAVAFAGFVLGATFVVVRDAVRAPLVTSFVLIAFFSFGSASSAFGRMHLAVDPRLVVAVLSAAVVGTLAFAVARTRRRLDVAGHAASVVAVVLVLIPTVQIGTSWWRARGDRIEPLQSRRSNMSHPFARHAATLPDIYYIVLDGYARHDAMREIYGYDNTAFLDGLRQRGFQVSTRSRANYCKTLHALASTLNMQYLHDLVDVPPTSVDSEPLIRLVRSSRAVHMLREAGYDIVAFASGYDLAEFGKVDEFLEGGHTWSEFASVLASMTPVPWAMGEKRDLHARHRQRLEYILDTIPELRRKGRPRFVFAHVLAPHPPFVFDREGRDVPVPRAFGFYDGSDFVKHGGTIEEYVARYAEQARWVTQRLEHTLDALLERYADAPPIVIVHSDHGPGSRLDWRSVTDTDLNERFGILMAALLPGDPAVDLGEAFSPVNAFRLVFDVYFGAEMPPLEHRSYFTFQSLPMRFIDVTDPDDPRDLDD